MFRNSSRFPATAKVSADERQSVKSASACSSPETLVFARGAHYADGGLRNRVNKHELRQLRSGAAAAAIEVAHRNC
jgi:hypothetical protein